MKQGANTNAMSTLSAGRDLTINAGRDANLQAADVSAQHDVAMIAGRDVNLLAAQDVSNYAAVQTAVRRRHRDGVVRVDKCCREYRQRRGKRGERLGRLFGCQRRFAGLKASDALRDWPRLPLGRAIGSLSVTAGFSYSQSETSSTISTPVVTTVRGGESVTIEATSGSITGHGAQILAGYDLFGNETLSADPTAGDITLSAGDTITLTSAQATSQQSGDSMSAGASIGVGIGLGLGGLNAGLTGSANGSRGENDANAVTRSIRMSPAPATSPSTAVTIRRWPARFSPATRWKPMSAAT